MQPMYQIYSYLNSGPNAFGICHLFWKQFILLVVSKGVSNSGTVRRTGKSAEEKDFVSSFWLVFYLKLELLLIFLCTYEAHIKSAYGLWLILFMAFDWNYLVCGFWGLYTSSCRIIHSLIKLSNHKRM